jgi:CheY-like chemotaxis protein
MARILLVDEDAATRLALRTLFEDEGYAVEEARDVRGALEKLHRSIWPYVALVDLFLPQTMGNVLLRELDRDPALARQHAFVMTSASLRMVSPDECALLERLCLPLVSKPYDLTLLCEVVAHAWAGQLAWTCATAEPVAHP